MNAAPIPRLGRKAAIVALILVVVGCSLPTDESAQVLTGPDIENAMYPSTTSTTGPVGSIDTEPRNVFFFDPDDILEAEPREVARDAGIAEILNLLGQGAVDEALLRSSVPPDFTVSSTEIDAEGVLTVILADETLFELGGSEVGRAVAQIVVTATQLEDWEITGVLFEHDGTLRPVPAGTELENVDEPVDECDYRQFLPDERCAEITSSTSMNTTSTTELVVPG